MAIFTVHRARGPYQWNSTLIPFRAYSAVPVNIPEGISLTIQLPSLPMGGFWIKRLVLSQMQANESILVSRPLKEHWC